SYRQVGMPATVPAPYAAPAPPLPQQPVEERLVAPRPAPARVKAYADETMELPIFRELESAWFQTRKPGPESALTQPAGRPDPQVDGTTSAGLPRRVPMAQLVPGGVEKEKAATVVNRRSPDQVRGLLSAYHRGVQRGRTRTGDDVKPPEPTTTGNSPQGGKEQ